MLLSIIALLQLLAVPFDRTGGATGFVELWLKTTALMLNGIHTQILEDFLLQSVFI